MSLVFSISNDYLTASSGVTFLLNGGGGGNNVAEVLWFASFSFPLIVVGQRRKLAKFLSLSDLALQTLLLVMLFPITLRSSLEAGISSPRTYL